nr:MAG TPA: hypothetical protein [Caudoviricetes sp.]
MQTVQYIVRVALIRYRTTSKRLLLTNYSTKVYNY